MKFSTKITYGLRAMMFLAKNKNIVSVTNLSQKEKISAKYLEHIFSKLKKAKLIEAIKGKSGGYKLKKSATQISILEIINALENIKSPFYCINKTGKIYCDPKCHCGVNIIFNKIEYIIKNELANIKLADLL